MLGSDISWDRWVVGRDLAVKKWLGLRSGRGQVKEEKLGVPRP